MTWVFVGFAPTLQYLAIFDPTLPIMRIKGSTSVGGSKPIEDLSEQGRYFHKGTAHIERGTFTWDAEAHNQGIARTPLDLLSEIQKGGFTDLPIKQLEVKFIVHSPKPDMCKFHFDKNGISKGFIYRIFTSNGVRLPEQDIMDIQHDLREELLTKLSGELRHYITRYAKSTYLEMDPKKTWPSPDVAEDQPRMEAIWGRRKWVKLADRHKESRSIEDTIVHRVTDE